MIINSFGYILSGFCHFFNFQFKQKLRKNGQKNLMLFLSPTPSYAKICVKMVPHKVLIPPLLLLMSIPFMVELNQGLILIGGYHDFSY